VCLLRGTNWVFKYNSNSFVSKGSITVPCLLKQSIWTLRTKCTYVCMPIDKNKEKMDECHSFRALVKKMLITENKGFFEYS